MGYDGSTYFPLLFFYSGKELGQQYGTEADYRALRQTADFEERGWAVFPPVPFNPLEADLADRTPRRIRLPYDTGWAPTALAGMCLPVCSTAFASVCYLR